MLLRHSGKERSIRVAGAQMPISTDLQFNKNEILKALDWAKENEVHHLLTPECALSGYNPNSLLSNNKDELEDALKEIENHIASNNMDIIFHLGTLFVEPEIQGHVNRNEVRHYEARDGGCHLFSTTNKIACVGADNFVIPGDEIDVHILHHRRDREYKMATLICNDMWEWDDNHMLNYKMSSEVQPDIIFHATNGVKFTPDMLRTELNSMDVKYNNKFVFNAFNDWHESHMTMTAIQSCATIVTVDSCVPWDWDPSDEITVDESVTSSESGIINPLGIRLTDVPRYGRQYFYQDIDLYMKEKCFDLIKIHANKTPYHHSISE
tara:strand:+ start:782 stop:1750 length:969 start_codon:yes stop_codon:yes gene_type:complete